MTRSPRNASKPCVNASRGNDLRKKVVQAGTCDVCLKRYKAYRGSQRFCSSRCRLLNWAVEALAAALKEGKAEGLRESINKLADPGKVKVKVIHIWGGRPPLTLTRGGR